MARKKRGKPKEEHASEAWLLPYSDLLTLLLALFIVLFALSAAATQNTQDSVSASFRSGFNAGGISFFDKMGTQTGYSAYLTADQSKDLSVSSYVAENNQLEQERQKLEQYIKENHLENDINTELTEPGLMIRIKEKALFPTGSAELTEDSIKVTSIVGDLLGKLSQNVTISGHTDNVPISNNRYRSNWSLSTQRALNFLEEILLKNPNLKPARFQATGNGEYRPAVPNDTPENRTKNRRVEVLIERRETSSAIQRIP